MSRIESNNNLFFHNVLHYISQKGEKLQKISVTPSNLLLLTNADPLTPRSHY